jgi:hypothetical protein
VNAGALTGTGVSINDAALQGLKDIIAAYLEGRSRAEDAVNLTIAGHGALEELLPNADLPFRARVFIRAYWSLRLLAEPVGHRTNREEPSYLLTCLDAPETFSQEVANSFYRRGD